MSRFYEFGMLLACFELWCRWKKTIGERSRRSGNIYLQFKPGLLEPRVDANATLRTWNKIISFCIMILWCQNTFFQNNCIRETVKKIYEKFCILCFTEEFVHCLSLKAESVDDRVSCKSFQLEDQSNKCLRNQINTAWREIP